MALIFNLVSVVDEEEQAIEKDEKGYPRGEQKKIY